MKKEEGKAFDLNTEETTQKVLEVGTSTNETKIDDKTSFENFKVLYDGRIKEKCLADYGTIEDKELLEDTAKELYLASQELIPDEDTKSEGDLEEEKTKQEENVKWHGKTFKDKKNEAILDNNSKFLAHILNGVISDVQDKFNVTATGELDTGNKNKVVVTLKGNTLDLIDATSYLAKSIRRDDVDFTFDDEIKNNTVRCVISPKVKTESKEDDSIEQIENRIKEINKQLSYIRRRDRVSLSIGSEEEQEELRSERAKLNDKLRKLRNDKVNMDKMTPEQQEEFKQKLKDLELWDGTEEGLPGAIQIYRLFHMKDESKELSESKENDNEYNYMLLSRLKSDCDYFLGNGNRYEKHLWAGNVDDQIAKMKELYNKLPEKPEWLTMEDIENYEKEMKQDVKTESRDRVAENLPKFVYDLTKSDFDKYGETAWTASEPKKDNNGRTVYEVYRNGKSDFKIADVVAEIQKEFPELKLSLQSTAPGDRVFFVKETKKQESQSTEVGYNEFTEDMEEIERTINFIKEPKNKDAKEVLDDVKEFLNKLWADKEQNTFGIKYAENKKIEETVTIDEISKIHSEIDEANSLKEIQNVIDKISDKSLQRQVQITFDEYDKDDNEDMDEDLEEVKDEIIQTLEDNAEYDDKNKSLKEESPKADKVLADIINDEKDSVEGYRDTIMEMGLSKEDFIDMITTENEHKLMNEKGLTKEQEAEVYGKLYDTLV